MRTLFLMVGIPASGKTDWVQKQLADNPTAVCVSRDDIRQDLINPNDESPFMHEQETFDIFVNQINTALRNPEIEEIYIDDTSLNEGFRNATLDALNIPPDVQICAVNIIADFQTTAIRNSTRPYWQQVPQDLLFTMRDLYVPAGQNEKYHYEIINVITDEQEGVEKE